jgi:hypothetical protein
VHWLTMSKVDSERVRHVVAPLSFHLSLFFNHFPPHGCCYSVPCSTSLPLSQLPVLPTLVCSTSLFNLSVLPTVVTRLHVRLSLSTSTPLLPLPHRLSRSPPALFAPGQVITRLLQRKRLFWEQQSADGSSSGSGGGNGSSSNILDQYSAAVAAAAVAAAAAAAASSTGGGGGGAVLFCVVGAKLSEGINFSDGLARCVCMVGLPFPNPSDPELKARMAYFARSSPAASTGPTTTATTSATTPTATTPTSATASNGAAGIPSAPSTSPRTTTAPTSARRTSRSSDGQEYYENICMRAVNQSIGRAIRHRLDHASIVLIDARFAEARIRRKLPRWIDRRVQVCVCSCLCARACVRACVGKRESDCICAGECL